MKHTPWSALLFLSLAPVPVRAADSSGSAAMPYGAALPGAGGFLPRAWIAGGPYLGSSAFRFTVDQGSGGTPAVLLVSSAAARIPFLGGEVLVDPLAPLFGVWGVTLLSGAPGAPGQGAGSVPFPLPRDLLLEELDLFAQWLLLDAGATGGVALSDGVRVTLRRDALVVAGVGYGLVTVVPPAGPVQPVSGVYTNDVQVNRAATLLINTTAGLGASASISDLRVLPPSPLAGVSLSHAPNCIAVHPAERRAYLVVPGSGSPAILLLDIQRSSATFGTLVGQVAGMPATALDLEGASISADGRVLVVAAMGLTSPRGLLVVDVDPGSPTRDQLVRTLPISSPGGLLMDVEVSADGQFAYTCHAGLPGPSEVAMVHLQTGVVLTRQGWPDQFAQDLDLDPRGRFLVVATANTHALGIVDLTPGTGFFQVRSVPTGFGVFSVALAPDGNSVVGVGQAGDLAAFAVATGAQLWRATIPLGGACVAVR